MHVIELIILHMLQKKVIIEVNQYHMQDYPVHLPFDKHYKLKQLKLKLIFHSNLNRRNTGVFMSDIILKQYFI